MDGRAGALEWGWGVIGGHGVKQLPERDHIYAGIPHRDSRTHRREAEKEDVKRSASANTS